MSKSNKNLDQALQEAKTVKKTTSKQVDEAFRKVNEAAENACKIAESFGMKKDKIAEALKNSVDYALDKNIKESVNLRSTVVGYSRKMI